MIVYKHLTAQERSQCLRFGAIMKCAELGFTTRELDKVAEGDKANVLGFGAGMMKLVAGLALATGIPIGVAAHVVGRHINQERTKERELQEQIKYYQNTTEGLRQALDA
jgi:hypothetical protein